MHPGRRARDVVIAFVEVDVEPAARPAMVYALCRDARAATVEEATTGCDLLVTAIVPDQQALTVFVFDDLLRMSGVRRADTHLATAVHREGSRWRLDALDQDQQAALSAIAGPTVDSRPTISPERYRPLVEALTYDGRRSAAELARITGRNPATVRRQVSKLLASELLSFRCDVAWIASEWPVVSTWWARVSAEEAERTIRSLTTLPELRLCASTAGKSNLMFTLWSRSVADLVRLERLLGEQMPWLSVNDMSVMLRAPKRMGWLLDSEGRNTGEVVPATVQTLSR